MPGITKLKKKSTEASAGHPFRTKSISLNIHPYRVEIVNIFSHINCEYIFAWGKFEKKFMNVNSQTCDNGYFFKVSTFCEKIYMIAFLGKGTIFFGKICYAIRVNKNKKNKYIPITSHGGIEGELLAVSELVRLIFYHSLTGTYCFFNVFMYRFRTD